MHPPAPNRYPPGTVAVMEFLDLGVERTVPAMVLAWSELSEGFDMAIPQELLLGDQPPDTVVTVAGKPFHITFAPDIEQLQPLQAGDLEELNFPSFPVMLVEVLRHRDRKRLRAEGYQILQRLELLRIPWTNAGGLDSMYVALLAEQFKLSQGTRPPTSATTTTSSVPSDTSAQQRLSHVDSQQRLSGVDSPTSALHIQPPAPQTQSRMPPTPHTPLTPPIQPRTPPRSSDPDLISIEQVMRMVGPAALEIPLLRDVHRQLKLLETDDFSLVNQSCSVVKARRSPGPLYGAAAQQADDRKSIMAYTTHALTSLRAFLKKSATMTPETRPRVVSSQWSVQRKMFG